MTRDSLIPFRSYKSFGFKIGSYVCFKIGSYFCFYPQKGTSRSFCKAFSLFKNSCDKLSYAPRDGGIAFFLCFNLIPHHPGSVYLDKPSVFYITFIAWECFHIISGWWFQPLWKILVSWDDYSHHMEKQNSCSKPPARFIHHSASVFSGRWSHWVGFTLVTHRSLHKRYPI